MRGLMSLDDYGVVQRPTVHFSPTHQLLCVRALCLWPALCFFQLDNEASRPEGGHHSEQCFLFHGICQRPVETETRGELTS